jgi:alcohol dehydrogenase
MQPFELSRVPAIFFGPGCLGRLGREVAARLAPGGAVMIIADPAMQSLGWTDRVTGMLAEKQIRSAVYADFKGEPKVSEIDRATAAARALSAELVVGIGGGSALDTAKLVAATARSGLSAAAYALAGDRRSEHRRYRIGGDAHFGFRVGIRGQDLGLG